MCAAEAFYKSFETMYSQMYSQIQRLQLLKIIKPLICELEVLTVHSYELRQLWAKAFLLLIKITFIETAASDIIFEVLIYNIIRIEIWTYHLPDYKIFYINFKKFIRSRIENPLIFFTVARYGLNPFWSICLIRVLHKRSYFSIDIYVCLLYHLKCI